MGSDAMITAVASLLEAPDAPLSCSGSIFFIYRQVPLVRHTSMYTIWRRGRRVARRNMFLVYHVIHDACIYEDNRMSKFFLKLEQVITW